MQLKSPSQARTSSRLLFLAPHPIPSCISFLALVSDSSHSLHRCPPALRTNAPIERFRGGLSSMKTWWVNSSSIIPWRRTISPHQMKGKRKRLGFTDLVLRLRQGFVVFLPPTGSNSIAWTRQLNGLSLCEDRQEAEALLVLRLLVLCDVDESRHRISSWWGWRQVFLLNLPRRSYASCLR